MQVKTDEIADGIYRLSVHVSDIAPPAGFTFNHFLIRADEPMLFHCGLRGMFPALSEAVARLIPVEQLRWIGFGHVEADECGAMNSWLAAAPRAQVVHGATACMVSVNDLADRAPRTLADGETVDLGGKRVRYVDTPHVPHGWEAGVLYEEASGTLLCGDLFTHLGNGLAVTDKDIVGTRDRGRKAVPLHQPRPRHRAQCPQARGAQAAHARGHARRLLQWQRRSCAQRAGRPLCGGARCRDAAARRLSATPSL